MIDYRAKTDAELRYILRDAGEAAECMRGHDYSAECKYLDQINSAATELHRRQHTAQDIGELMRAWDTIMRAARTQFPDLGDEEIYQLTAGAMRAALKIG